jgi:hypothetical protein
MTTEHDSQARIVLSWLRQDAHEDAERVLLRALDEVDATPQRRSWWPARRPFMPTYAKLVAAAAALVVVAVLGFNILPRNGIGGPPAPTPTVSPAPTANLWPSDDTNELPAGSYVTGDPFPVRLTATVPAGWHGHVAGPYYADLWPNGYTGANGLYFVLPSMVAVDPCDYAKGFADVGGLTVGALTAALRNEPGLQVSVASSTTIGGYPATQLVVTAPAVISSCALSPEGLVIWKNPLGGISPGLKAGESIRLWILDVAGQRLVIVMQDAAYSAAKKAEAQAVFDSIRIEPGA